MSGNAVPANSCEMLKAGNTLFRGKPCAWLFLAFLLLAPKAASGAAEGFARRCFLAGRALRFSSIVEGVAEGNEDT
jgi:hypothetical protein